MITCKILKFVASSATEAELGALFVNTKEARILQLTLQELGHPQPQNPIHVNNTTVIGIVNDTIKRQRLRAMKMQYFWLLDQMAQQYFKFYSQPGLENLADYPTKHHLWQIPTRRSSDLSWSQCSKHCDHDRSEERRVGCAL